MEGFFLSMALLLAAIVAALTVEIARLRARIKDLEWSRPR